MRRYLRGRVLGAEASTGFGRPEEHTMNRSDLYYLPAEIDYRRARAAKAARRSRRRRSSRLGVVDDGTATTGGRSTAIG